MLPLVKTAVSKIMLQISTHTELDKFLAECDSRLLGSSKVMIYIEASTSRPKFVYELFELLPKILQKPRQWCLWCPLQCRFELIGKLMEQMQTTHASKAAFVVYCSHEHKKSKKPSNQRHSSRPSMALYIPFGNKKDANVVTWLTRGMSVWALA